MSYNKWLLILNVLCIIQIIRMTDDKHHLVGDIIQTHTHVHMKEHISVLKKARAC